MYAVNVPLYGRLHFLASFGETPSPTTGSVHNTTITSSHFHQTTRAQLNPLEGPIFLELGPEVDAVGTLVATMHAIWSQDAPFSNDGKRQWHAAHPVPYDAVAAVETSFTSASAPNGELTNDDGQSSLEQLNVCDSRVLFRVRVCSAQQDCRKIENQLTVM